MYRNTYVEVNLDHINNNVKKILKKYDDYQYYIGVVKGNAYGHGMYVVKEMISSGINYLAVSCLEEAIDIRDYDKKIPILCLEPISLKYIDDIISNQVTISIPNLEYLKALLKLNFVSKIKIHLKIDSGMHRLGFSCKDLVKEAVTLIENDKRIILEGIFTHFATTGIADKNWDQQLNNFKEITSLIDLSKIPIVHMGRSLTLLTHPKIPFCNGIRLGIILYGFNTTPKYSNSFLDKLRQIKANYLIKKYDISETSTDNDIDLIQSLELYSEILQIKKVKKGEYVGYGTSFRALNDIIVATVGIGYADGIGRKHSGRSVVINKKRYPIIGEVGMNMLSVLIDDTVKQTDIVKIMGDGISIREVSYYIGNSTYETLAMLPKSLPRVYIKNNKKVYIEEI